MILVYEALSDPVYDSDEQVWKVPCRVKFGKDAIEFEEHTFTISEEQNARDFKEHVDGIQDSVHAYMNYLAKELFVLQTMVDNDDYFIILTEENEDDDEDDGFGLILEPTAPRYLN